MQLYHIGSQEELPVAVQEEQTGSDPQETQAQEVPRWTSKKRIYLSVWTTNPIPSNEASPGAF
jgi:hypothetical protein